MTKRVVPVPIEADGVPTPSHEKAVKIQEFFRKSGVPVKSITSVILKRTCVEAVMKGGGRKVLNYGI